MGTLIYNGRMNLCIDDHVLAHLQVVILTKLRRHEAFAFTWDDGGRATVCWINPSLALEFIYSSIVRPHLNHEWLEMMATSANTNAGLVVMPEPASNGPMGGPSSPRSPVKRRPVRPMRSRPAPPPSRELVSA
jgi:hypothetical protein